MDLDFLPSSRISFGFGLEFLQSLLEFPQSGLEFLPRRPEGPTPRALSGRDVRGASTGPRETGRRGLIFQIWISQQAIEKYRDARRADREDLAHLTVI